MDLRQPSDDKASKRQIAYIRALGGVPPEGLTSADASALIESLLPNAPATQNQLNLLKRLGATIPEGLTCQQASKLIDTTQNVPDTTPPTRDQLAKAVQYGVMFPKNISTRQADDLLECLDVDSEDQDYRPVSPTLVAKIRAIGADVLETISNNRAELYFEGLTDYEYDFELRVEMAIEAFFGDEESRVDVRIRKPSKVVMAQALWYGEDQGWGLSWERFADNAHTLMGVAVFAVAPGSLKKGKIPPRLAR